MSRHALAFVLAILVSGCQSGVDRSMTGIDAAGVDGPAANAIANDMTSGLVEQIGPAANRSIRLDTDGTDYAIALEAALKAWGFIVVGDSPTPETLPKDQEPMELDHAIDSVDGQALARLTSSTIALARAYTVTATGAVPSSPLSIRRQN